MTLNSKFNAYIPMDNQDILIDDLEQMNNTIHSEIANRDSDSDTNWSGSGWTGTKQPRGIIHGMILTINTGASRIDVSAGIGKVDGLRAVLAGTENIAFASLSVNDYIVARVSYVDGSPRMNPITGDNEDLRRTYSTTLTNAASPVITTDVILGKVTAINGGIPVLGVMASSVFTESGNTLTIVAQSGSADYYGFEGNKYHIRFYTKVGQTLSVNLQQDSAGAAFRYLTVNLACNSLGVNTSTLTEIATAINTFAGTYYKATVGGTGTFVPTTLQVTYANHTALSGGTDYATHIQMITGSSALQKNTQFNVNDPYTKHLSQKGTGTQSDKNPHGTSLDDIGLGEVTTELHIRREHYRYASIPKINSANFLKATISNTQITIAKGATGDIGLIAGGIVTALADYSLNDPSASFRLYYFYLNGEGSITSKYVATYDSTTVVPSYSPIQLGDHAVISIIRTPKELTGVKTLRLVVSGTGTVYTAYFGSGSAINISDSSRSYILKDADGSWIEIWRESETLVDGDYRNYVTFQTWSDETELPSTFAFWKGNQDEWGYDGTNERYIDLRLYGSFDSLNELNNAGSGASPARMTTFEQSDYLYYTGTTMDLKVAPFEIEFKGARYRNGSTQTFTLTSDTTHFVLASFSNATMTISIEASTGLSTFNNRNAVVIGRATTNGTNITGVYPIWVRNNYISSQDIMTFDACTETDLWAALVTYKGLSTATKLPPVAINIRSDMTINTANAAQYGLSTLTLSNAYIYGHGHKLTVSGASQFTLASKCHIYDTRIDHSAIVFNTSSYDIAFHNCNIVQAGATEFLTGTTGTVTYNNCILANWVKTKLTSVNGIVFYNRCTVNGQVTGKGSVNATGTVFNKFISYDAATTGINIKASGCSFEGCQIYMASGIYGKSQYDNCSFLDSDIYLDDANNYLMVDNCIFDYESIISMNGKALISNTAFFGDNSMFYIVGGIGTYQINNCIIPQVQFTEALAKVFISNTVISYTIKTKTNNIYLKNIDWLNTVQADALVGWDGTDGMNIYADGINGLTQSTGGLVKDVTTGTAGTVNMYLSNSDFRRDSYTLITTGLLVVRFNISNSRFWNWGYQLPTGTTTGLFDAVNSDLQDIRYHINTNTTKTNNLINYKNCTLRWNAQRAFNGAAIVTHDGCKIITSHLDNYSASNANVTLKFLNMDIASMQLSLNPSGTPNFDLYYDNVNLDAHYLDIGGILNLNLFMNNIVTSGTTRLQITGTTDLNIEINNSKLVSSSSTFMTIYNQTAGGEALINISNSKVAMASGFIKVNVSNSAQTKVNLNACGSLTDITGTIIIDDSTTNGAINVVNSDLRSTGLLAPNINIDNSYINTYVLIYGSTNGLTSIACRITNSQIVGADVALIDLSTATAMTSFTLRTANSQFIVQANLIDCSAAFPTTFTWFGTSTEINCSNYNLISRTYANQLDMYLYLSGCKLSNVVLNQGNGRLDGVIDGCYLNEAFVLLKNTTASKSVLYYLIINNCDVKLTATSEYYKYLVAIEWQNNATGISFHPQIRGCRFEGSTSSANFRGGGLVGIHFTESYSASLTFYGNIVVQNCSMKVNSASGDLTNNEWAILRYSTQAGTGITYKYFNGGINISDVDIECNNNINNMASFIRGDTDIPEFSVALDIAVLAINPIQFIAKNLHMRRGKTSRLGLRINKATNNIVNTTVIDNITHAPILNETGMLLTYYNEHDYSTVSINGLTNPKLTGAYYPTRNIVELDGGNDLSITNCKEMVWTLNLNSGENSVNISGLIVTNMLATGVGTTASVIVITNTIPASNIVSVLNIIAKWLTASGQNFIIYATGTYRQLVINQGIRFNGAGAPDNNVNTFLRGDENINI